MGEDIASDYLIKNDISLVGRNIRTAYGEIDILGKKDGCLIFVEVKTRRSKRFGFPEASVDEKKQKHMVNSALAYLQENGDLDQNWRIDVISVNLLLSEEPKIEWFKNAITS